MIFRKVLAMSGWVEPSDAELAAPLPRHPHPPRPGVENQLVQVAGLPHGILVQRCDRVEDGLAEGEPRQPIVDAFWDGPDDAGGVVTVHMDVLGL